MDKTMNSQTKDHTSDEHHVVPLPILSNTNCPVMVILTPEQNDPMFTDIWQFSFKKLASKFEALGVRAIAAPWLTTPLSSEDSHSFIYIANLAWGYHRNPDRWYAWLHAWPKEIKLINSPSLLLWNSRKTYLKELEKAGVPTIPTLYVENVNEQTLIDAAAHFATSDLIIKPQISACSYNMIRVRVNNTDNVLAPKSLSISEAIIELTRLGANHSTMMMIQPFMKNVVQEGEMSVFVFRGKVSHAVLSNTQPDDYRVQFEHGGVTTALKQPSTEMLELVRIALGVCPETPIYARVDMIRNHITGCLCIIELELIEPNLFLEHAPDEGMAFVQAILQSNF